ncbi:hypothetical protein K438DRAFT_1765393 [Mycena galopus ATCC 62051]|nr:hypothetical protein K438DRAFT_1765393 [Mycena galopus ATCC 62051]
MQITLACGRLKTILYAASLSPEGEEILGLGRIAKTPEFQNCWIYTDWVSFTTLAHDRLASMKRIQSTELVSFKACGDGEVRYVSSVSSSISLTHLGAAKFKKKSDLDGVLSAETCNTALLSIRNSTGEMVVIAKNANLLALLHSRYFENIHTTDPHRRGLLQDLAQSSQCDPFVTVVDYRRGPPELRIEGLWWNERYHHQNDVDWDAHIARMERTRWRMEELHEDPEHGGWENETCLVQTLRHPKRISPLLTPHRAIHQPHPLRTRTLQLEPTQLRIPRHLQKVAEPAPRIPLRHACAVVLEQREDADDVGEEREPEAERVDEPQAGAVVREERDGGGVDARGGRGLRGVERAGEDRAGYVLKHGLQHAWNVRSGAPREVACGEGGGRGGGERRLGQPEARGRVLKVDRIARLEHGHVAHEVGVQEMSRLSSGIQQRERTWAQRN